MKIYKYLTKLTSVFLTLITTMLLLAAPVSALDTTAISLGSTAVVDDEVTAEITLSYTEGFYAVSFEVQYNRNILEYVSGAGVGCDGLLKIVEAPSGEKTATYSLKFRAISNGECRLSVNDVRISVLGANGAETVSLTNASSSITVKAKPWVYDIESKTLTVNEDTIPDYDESFANSPWYEYKTEAKALILNGNVKRIGSFAFSKMVALERVILPEGVEEIGEGAFSDCKLLKSINIPSSTLEIGQKAFYNCNSLEGISLVNTSYINDYAFYRCNKLKKLSLHNAVYIGNFSFNGCDNLTEVTFSSRLSAVGEHAFGNCKRLLKAELPPTLLFADETVFEGSDKANRLLGDLIGDGNLNSQDIISLRQILLGSKSHEALADLNNDCEIDIRDVIAFKKLLAAL